jgi:hypothetical protein
MPGHWEPSWTETALFVIGVMLLAILLEAVIN